MHSQLFLQLVKYLQRNKLTKKKGSISLLDVIETLKKYKNRAFTARENKLCKRLEKMNNHLRKQLNCAKVSCKTCQNHKQLKRETVLIKSGMENRKILITWVSLLLSIAQQTSETPITTTPCLASILYAEIQVKQQWLKIRRASCGY